jgi:hypothetical protein
MENHMNKELIEIIATINSCMIDVKEDAFKNGRHTANDLCHHIQATSLCTEGYGCNHCIIGYQCTKGHIGKLIQTWKLL